MVWFRTLLGSVVVGGVAISYGFKTASTRYMAGGAVFVLVGLVVSLWLLVGQASA